MGDPITALAAIGLADSVLSFLSLAIKLSREAYKAQDGLSNHITKQLESSTESLENGLTKLNRGAHKGELLSKPDQDLINIARECEGLAHEFLESLEKYKAVSPGRFRSARAMQTSLKAVWDRKKIQEF